MPVETLQSSDALVSEHARDYEPAPANGKCQEEEVEIQLEGPYDRLLGDTEHNWCRAVSGGTGITVLGFLFRNKLSVSDLQTAIDVVQLQHPRLRSQLLWMHGRPAFQVCEEPIVEVEVVEKSQVVEDVGGEEGAKGWLKYVEDELNTNIWPEREHCTEPVQVFVVRLYVLPENRSVMILRLHTAACDRVSAATVSSDILKALHKIVKGQEATSLPLQHGTGMEVVNSGFDLPPVEATIPPGKANKPFWAHGIDLLGYSLGSRRHALLPFHDPESPRRSGVIRSFLSVDHTQALLQACANAKANLSGALCAAGLKAAAAAKQLGNRAEHYAVINLVDCRKLLEPSLSDDTVGFYHSALMLTHHVSERAEFWDLARRCTSSLDNAMNNRKHFTDMGDLNYLMYQAISHPNLTPASSLRTSLLVTFRDTLADEMGEWAAALGVEDFVGCSSIHGVGPSLAIFDAIRNGELHCTNVFPAPLHSRAQMQAYVDSMMAFLVEFLP